MKLKMGTLLIVIPYVISYVLISMYKLNSF